MSDLKLSGTITVINDVNVINDKFQKREFVVNDNGMYPQMIMFQFTQDKCNVLDGYKLGQSVDVSFNLRGREWTSPSGEVKYFNTLEAWRIEAAEGVSEPVTPGAPTATSTAEDDDLPF